VKIASRKKNRPSMPNGRPSTAPYLRISPGQSRPISNESTVPVTAPTATSTPMACDQRRASSMATPSLRRSPMNSASSTIVGSAMPRQARMMWKPSVVAIWARAGTTSPVTRAAATTATCPTPVTVRASQRPPVHPAWNLAVTVLEPYQGEPDRPGARVIGLGA
jgi:hypothetical protein